MRYSRCRVVHYMESAARAICRDLAYAADSTGYGWSFSHSERVVTTSRLLALRIKENEPSPACYTLESR
jgi:hypothetical protein